ncbi:hypothetical protein BK026_15060 [Alteromonas sp. V450]|uniref:hypothetical protein n=1 Tax=Alteromonas sp. V450 TaxID=1912139 RepID=UPI0008FF4891|nr:hypothetical protein [Alteromonas sp. V450]OJF69987.1 hypothetical protein BK026_15060 [Alteromonas sp. V450]
MNRIGLLKWLLICVLLVSGIGFFAFIEKADTQSDAQTSALNKKRARLISQAVCSLLKEKDETRSVNMLANVLRKAFSSEPSQLALEQQVSQCELALDEREMALLTTLFMTLPLDKESALLLHNFALQKNTALELTEALKADAAGTFNVYHLDEIKQLLAFSVTTEKRRIYVAVNLSYDTHEMPLPLGFMASTKVKLWKSDAGELSEFVTQGSLSIAAFSTALVILE